MIKVKFNWSINYTLLITTNIKLKFWNTLNYTGL